LTRVGRSNAENFAKLIIGNGDCIRCAPRRSVLDAAQPDLGVAARNRLVDGCEGNFDELRLAPQAAGNQFGDVDIEANNFGRIGGIGFDIRRPAFRVPTPAKYLRGLRDEFRMDGEGQHQRNRDKADHRAANIRRLRTPIKREVEWLYIHHLN
jgi:hypothetical protein